jgi:predicted NBD/HSP70 family sugar kinase
VLINFSQNREDLGRRNRGTVLSEILFRGPISRSHIATRVGLTPATVSRITRQLIDLGLVIEDEVIDDGRPGRRFIRLKINPTGCFVAGISVNVFRQDVAITDLSNATVACRRLESVDIDDGSRFLEHCADTLNNLIEETAIDRGRVVGCGVTITGAVDPNLALLRTAPALGWPEIDVGSILRKKLDMPLFFDSIANAKNLTANGFGSSKGLANVVLLNVSLAIGCSLLVDGRLMRGPNFSAGLIDGLLIPDEASHTLKTLDNIAGGYAVIKSLTEDATLSGSEAATALVRIIEDDDRGDEQASNALNAAGRALAFAVANINALLHPEIILLSGPMIESEAYCGGVRSRLSAMLDSDFVNDHIRFAHISNQEAACSLAIFQSLAIGEVSNQLATKST